MATGLPDDGIPVLTDIVDSSMPQAAPPPPPAGTSPSDPMFKTVPMALLDAAALAAQETGGGRAAAPPNPATGTASRSGPPSARAARKGEGPSGSHPGAAHAAAQVYKAPPIDGPPSLSEFSEQPRPVYTLPLEAQERLAASVHSAVLNGLLARVEPLLEARLKDRIADVLERVLADVTAELKDEAREIVRDAVARCVVEEMAALRARSAAQNPTVRPGS